MTSLSRTLSRALETGDRYGWFSAVFTDRVVLALIAGFVGLVLLDQQQAGRSLVFTLEALLAIAPFFLLAVGFAGYAKASGMDAVIARAFSGNPTTAVVAAALVGALSPFCSCGVIPLIAALLAAGVPLAPVMAFWVSSPIMDPEMFILTAAGIGFDFALAKGIAAIGMGLLAGFGVLAMQRAGLLGDPLQKTTSCGSCCGSRPPAGGAVVWRFWRHPERRAGFFEETRSVGWFLGKWLTLAFFLESLMVVYVPATWIADLLGSGTWFAIPLAAVVGIPSYLNGYAAIPLVSGLLDMGMAPGAAMAFVTAGAVSSIPAAIAVYALVKKPVFAVYLALGLIGALLAGYGYNVYSAL